MIRRIEKIIKKKSQRSCSFIIYLINICFLYNKYALGGLIFLENKNRQKPFNFLNYYRPCNQKSERLNKSKINKQ